MRPLTLLAGLVLVVACLAGLFPVVEGSRPARAEAGTAAPTPTPTPTRTPTVSRTLTPTRTPTATRTPSPTAAATAATPAPGSTLPLPSRFYGTITWFGEPATAGWLVEAVIGDAVCGTSMVEGRVYALNVVNTLYRPGCGSGGATVTFRINGLAANESATFTPGAGTALMLTGPRMTETLVAAGCTIFASTYPDGTPPDQVADGFSPADALKSLWVWNDQAGDWLAYLPGVDEASSLSAVNSGDQLYICAARGATFRQPAR